jgi:hypothetical protein
MKLYSCCKDALISDVSCPRPPSLLQFPHKMGTSQIIVYQNLALKTKSMIEYCQLFRREVFVAGVVVPLLSQDSVLMMQEPPPIPLTGPNFKSQPRKNRKLLEIRAYGAQSIHIFYYRFSVSNSAVLAPLRGGNLWQALSRQRRASNLHARRW